MKALSQKRRHPLAAIILLAVALVLTGGLYAVASATNQAKADSEQNYTADDIAAGQKLFQSNCATCHGTSGEGTDNGPSLVGVGAAAVDFQVTDPRAATYEITNYIHAVDELTSATLRNVVGGLNLEQALTSRDQI